MENVIQFFIFNISLALSMKKPNKMRVVPLIRWDELTVNRIYIDDYFTKTNEKVRAQA